MLKGHLHKHLLVGMYLITTLSVCSQNVLRVDQTASGAMEDGASWATAYVDLADALAAAQNGDEIWVADGVYLPGTQREDSFQLKTGVGIYGGFTGLNPGLEETSRDQRDENPESNNTILSGDLNGDDGPGFTNYGDNSYHVVNGTGVGSFALLDGFTVCSGSATSATNRNNLGGGIICDGGGTPSFSNLLVTRNQASLVGGAMYLNQSSASSFQVTFFNNRTFATGSGVTGEGGAVYLNLANSFFIACRFLGNEATSNGGAISNHSSNPNFYSCLFSGNSTDENGGAIYSISNNATPTFLNCTVYGNRADAGQAGAFYQDGGTLWIQNTVASKNADSQGNLELANIRLVNGASVQREHSFVEGILELQAGPEGNVPGIELIGFPALFVDADGPDNQIGTLDDNFRLNAGTQLVNTGDTSLYSGLFAQFDKDLDGLPRIVPVEVEIGAYELQTMLIEGALSRDQLKDYDVAAPLTNVAISESWFPDTTSFNSGDGLNYNITPVSTSGTIAFSVAPQIDSEGVLSFGLVAGTSGTAEFDVVLQDPAGVFTAAQSINFAISVADASIVPVTNVQPSLPLRAYINVFGPFPSGPVPSSPGFLGEVKFFAADAAPGNEYLPADGRILPIASYTALFSLLGNTYGGDARTTFALPDLRGRVVVGAGSAPGLMNRPIGQVGGSNDFNLTAANLPNHRHDTIAEVPTDETGLGTPFSKMQPYVALHPIIVLNGVFPTSDTVCTGTETSPYIGEIRWYAGISTLDFTKAQGQLLPIFQFTPAFALWGTTYGGDGETSFALPDLRGRVAVTVGNGVGLTSRTVGQKFGVETGTLSEATMPEHGHVLPTGGVAQGVGGDQPIDTVMPSLGLHHVVCSVTGEVKVMATNFQMQNPGDGQSGRPDLFGRVVMGENATHPYLIPTGSETSTPTLQELDAHTHTGPPFLEWMSQFYPNETDPTIIGLFAEPRGVGANLIQFLLDGDPTQIDATILPEFSRDTTSVTYVFRHRNDAYAYPCFVQYGNDLVGWNFASNGVNGVSIAIDPDGYAPGVDRITVTIPHGGGDLFFARLLVRTP